MLVLHCVRRSRRKACHWTMRRLRMYSQVIGFVVPSVSYQAALICGCNLLVHANVLSVMHAQVVLCHCCQRSKHPKEWLDRVLLIYAQHMPHLQLASKYCLQRLVMGFAQHQSLVAQSKQLHGRDMRCEFSMRPSHEAPLCLL